MRLDLVIGPNGAGKSTFVELVLVPLRPGTLFVNADVIAATRWPDNPAGHSYEAARIAADTREAMIEAGEPFIAETVFSHRSKLDLISRAKNAGYTVAVHVMLVPEDLAVQRVPHRVAAGGHDVPEAKIRSRYSRLWPLVVEAIDLADFVTFFDNSQFTGPDEVAKFVDGSSVGVCRWPDWAPEDLRNIS